MVFNVSVLLGDGFAVLFGVFLYLEEDLLGLAFDDIANFEVNELDSECVRL